MARIRSVKPEFWGDRRLARVSRDARLLYIALWNLADEHGRLQGDARWIKGHCFPYDDDLGEGAVSGLLGELERLGRVQRYDADGDPYLFLPKLAVHQRLEPGKSESRLPEPPPPSVPTVAPAQTSPDSAQIVPDESAPIVAQQVAGSREHVAGSREAAAPTAAAQPPDESAPIVATSKTQRSKRITDAYAQAEPMCKWPAVNAIVLRAISAEKWADDEIRDGLLRLAKDGRGVTIETLRVELNGLPPARAAPSTTDTKVAATLRMAEQYGRQELDSGG